MCTEAKGMRGQRNERAVTEMMQSWCTVGLFTMGDPNSPANCTVIPAVNYVYHVCAGLAPSDPTRVQILRNLAQSAQDW